MSSALPPPSKKNSASRFVGHVGRQFHVSKFRVSNAAAVLALLAMLSSFFIGATQRVAHTRNN
jgi:hypothetical protein